MHPLRLVSIHIDVLKYSFCIIFDAIHIYHIYIHIFVHKYVTDNNSDTSSEWQNDWTSSDEFDKDIKYNSKRKVLSKTKKKTDKSVSSPANVDIDSDNSDGQLEKCPICLLPFRKQQVGTPSACEHCFCLECLLEWSKNINTCPVDRQIFTIIHVRNHLGGKVIKHLPVEVVPRPEDQVQDDPTFCEVCHLSDREDRMLLCDGCDCGYHLECLTPPMTEVPMEEWFCPECSQNSQNDAEAIEIDLDEISDLMEEARHLGVSYGRSRTGTTPENGALIPRIVPRTRHTERVRANIRNRTVRNTITNIRFIDPNQPSTSSGLDSIGDNSHSPNANFRACGRNTSSTRSNRTSKTKTTKKKRKKRETKSSARKNSTVVREVRIREINDNGEEEEIVTYVKVASSTSRRKCKKRTKKTRKRRKSKRHARTVSSVLADTRTVKKRLATALGMNKPKLDVPLLVPTMKNNISISEKSALKTARYNAGIPRVSLFGDNLGLDYSPPVSEDDDDEYSIGSGPLIVNVQRRSAVPSIRRRAVLKTIASSVNEAENRGMPNILDSIINSQELWHSTKKNNITLMADGTLLMNNPEKENKHSVNNNESPKKEKEEVVTQRKEVLLKEVETPLDLTNVNPNNITQAPMYNNPCGGGNRGNFRGGYRDNGRHGHHGGQSYGGGRDSLPPGGGRHGYGSGSGNTGPRDSFGNRDFGPPPFYNPSFEHCGGPPMFSGTPPPPFRSRNPQHFRNERLRFPPPIERPFNNYTSDGFERPPFPHAQDQRFPRPRLPPPLGIPPPPPSAPSVPPANPTADPLSTQSASASASASAHVRNSLPAGLPEMDVTRNYQSERSERASSCIPPEPVSAPMDTRQENNDDCDIYCDIEPPSKSDVQEEQHHGNGAMILLPPPEPPSSLLDFEENSRSDKDNDSEQELVIDDSHKEDHTPKNLTPSGDKYDPFAADSDSNDDNNAASSEKTLLEKMTEVPQNNMDSCNIPMPIAPPPMMSTPTSGPSMPTGSAASENRERPQEPSIRLTAYDDDDGDNESQSDCPNFSVYSSQTMDVARHTEQELSQQLGPLQPPPLPPSMPDDDDIIVGDVQACDLPDMPEPANPYLEALQKERQILSKIPPKKISHDSHRGKITFKIGNKLRLNNRLSGLHDDQSVNPQNHQLTSTDVAGSKAASQKVDRSKQHFHDQFVKRDTKKAASSLDDESQDKNADKSVVGPSKLAGESTGSRPSIILNQSVKMDSLFVIEEDGNTVAKIAPGLKKRESPRTDRRGSKECLVSSSDEEATKEEGEKSGRADALSADKQEAEGNKQEKEEEEEEEEEEDEASSPPRSAMRNKNVAIVENATGSSSSSSPTSLSPRKPDSSELDIEHSPENLDADDGNTSNKVVLSHRSNDGGSRSETSLHDDSREQESSSDDDDRSLSNRPDGKTNRDKYDNDRVLSDDNDNEDLNISSDQQHEKTSPSYSDDEVEEQFPIEKDKLADIPIPSVAYPIDNNWESDGAYTPCKDELPVKDEDGTLHATSSFEDGGLEPITPTKDKANDDLDDCRTPPASYAGLGTEDISETDEAINFEEELLNLAALRKEKEMEDGEILDESKLNAKEQREKSREKEDDTKRRKKKDKKEKSKENTEKNKENISSDNLVSWKKISKSTKERQYRDKDRRSKSREKEKGERDKDKDKSSKKKVKEVSKKKEKRKELPRYDVRKIVAEKPRPRKDEYGRDIREKSRSRSRSRSSGKVSGSKDRRSRSYSKGRTRSRSRVRLSWSRDRRSYSKSCRSISRNRRSTSRNRRKSSRRRSMSRKRSLSRRHSVTRRRSRSLSRKRRSSLSPRRRSRRSLSRSRDKRKDKTKKYKSRSRSRNRKRSRSKSPKRTTSKSREKKHSKRKPHSRSRSKGGRSCSRDRDRNARNWEQLNEKSVEQHPTVEQREFPREREARSWSAQWTPSWSHSRSKTPAHMQQEQLGSRNCVSPKNLTVILTNKEAIKKKKKERRKESRKSKSESEKRRKGKRNRTPPPSKEVFASGDNILVSVCFNKDNETNPTAMPELQETIPCAPPIKRRRRDSVQTVETAPPKRSKKEKTKDKRSKSPKVKKDKKKKSKAAEIAATKKPVAVIDLDQSPFREQTPSPRDVIVLSDDDDKQAQEVATPEQCPPSQVVSPPREQFVSQGPKTPPEPQIKFSINKQPSNLRPSLINPLLEEEEEEEEMEEEEMMDERAEEELEMRAQEELELRLKIGPNTPPEPPTSPLSSSDVYDPFDPTKSRSPTPDASQEATPNDEHDRAQRNSPRKHDTADTPLPDEPSQSGQDQPSQEKPPEKPKIISMVTIKRASPQRDTASPAPENQTDIAQSCSSPPKTQQNQQNVQSTANPFATINPVLATVAAAVQRSAVFNASTPNTTQRTLLQSNRTSPSNQIKQRTNDRPQLPNIFTNSTKTTMARSSKSTQGKNSSTIGQNGSDAAADITNDNVDMSSPYSPGSTLSDGLFDPPSPVNFNSSPVVNAPPATTKTSSTPKVNKSAEKKDAFDALFGAVLPPVKAATKNRSKKTKEKTKKSTNPKVGVRMDENQLQILDDLPSSAVEMQVKDKFLKKLNRQERVVEEVKLVLKPHYTKKHVTKEEYKDIMRKAVPKICHNKTGEINPKKIAHLIEAYVRKCRNNKKKTSSAKISKPA
ncbi:RING and PHD-finger domain-containing protein KIAA1542 [Harpegnathos saltator]|uniref:RING and PHD-finger domain-containing protein KIAA1542 n=1 Tax=Harpegnathos saltator TaxID=610380 RepID=E2BW47_HARSA|nr:RING and PHD-finger domain-containing protein KIAA1542 [Harpegnathos saltator]